MFLPTNKKEMEERGWTECDIILITGDAYVDHPSFGIALIGRVLESKGYRVGIIAQPKTDDDFSDFKKLGKPKLFWGISSGNMDSIVSNYTAAGKIRNKDMFSDEGDPFYVNNKGEKRKKRPDRATAIYTQIVKQLFKNSFIVLGGVEASLRRFTHYDYLQQKVRHSILIDTKADILVYGMGEKAIVEIADNLKKGKPIKKIKGTALLLPQNRYSISNEAVLPSHKELKTDYSTFPKQFNLIQKNSNPKTGNTLIESDGAWYIVQYPPQDYLKTEELDQIYALPFERKPHPSYKKIPAYDMIKFSITSHRGCAGGCSFCGIGVHQGKIIRSRSEKSILAEIEKIKKLPSFKGHITDIGGPSADMYGAKCEKHPDYGCNRPSCLYPTKCKHFKTDMERYLSLLEKSKKKVKKVSIGSGLRLDIAMAEKKYIEKITENYLSGYLKVAPEHISETVLDKMRKFKPKVIKNFFSNIEKIKTKKIIVRPYIIVGHPGEKEKDIKELYNFLKNKKIDIEAIQEFTPTPLTYSTALYLAQQDENGIFVPHPKHKENRKSKELLLSLNKKSGKNPAKLKKNRNEKYRFRKAPGEK